MISEKSLALVSGEKPKLERYSSGQEYFLHTMISALKELGYETEVKSAEELPRTFSTSGNIHFYYTPFKPMTRLSLKNTDARKCFHVYQLEDATWNALKELKWKLEVILAHPFINKYLVTSRSLQKGLESFGISKDKINRVDPFYDCRCDSFENIESLLKRGIENISSDEPLKFLYLGRINQQRLPLSSIIESLLDHPIGEGRMELKVVSTSGKIPRGEKTINDILKLEFVNEYLSEEKKCYLYKNADFFLYLAGGNVAMNPPITILEAVYHGTIPLVSFHLLKDLNFPKELVVKRVDELPFIVENLTESKSTQEKVMNSLFKFSFFYRESRYKTQLRNLMEG